MMAKKKAVIGSETRWRPPIVTVMGHVDHGKTTLLDYIRQSNLTAREAGGITQTIGAYQVAVNLDGREEKITFIDTPGHAAFAKMRARGAQVTDLAVLVVAADEGVKAQTRESLDHIRAAKLPFIVAINKIDLPQANPDQVKAQLAELGVVSEDYGGKISMVPISAKTGQGVEDLLELIILLGKMLELEAKSTAPFQGVVLEARRDPRRGIVATVIVKQGQLTPRQTIYLGDQPFRVRAIFDDHGRGLKQAEPGQPVELLGLGELPAPGILLTAQPQKKVLPAVEKKPVAAAPASSQQILAQLGLATEEKTEPKLRIILRAASQGELEAVMRNLPAGVEAVSAAVGNISETDVFLAQTSRASIYGFRVKADVGAQREASQQHISLKTFAIIYELLQDLETSLEELKAPLASKIVGRAEILAIFPFDKKRVAGCRVTEGKLNKQWRVKLQRGEEDLGSARIISLRRGKTAVEEVSAGNECGVLLEPQLDFKVGDVLLSYSNSKEGIQKK